MNYLSDELLVDEQIQGYGESNVLYTVYRYEFTSQSWVSIYVGQTFCEPNYDAINFCVNSILESVKASLRTGQLPFTLNGCSTYQSWRGIYDRFRVIVSTEDQDTFDFDVLLSYQYDHDNYTLDLVPHDDTNTAQVTILKGSNVVPHYPYKNTSKYRFGLTTYCSVKSKQNGNRSVITNEDKEEVFAYNARIVNTSAFNVPMSTITEHDAKELYLKGENVGTRYTVSFDDDWTPLSDYHGWYDNDLIMFITAAQNRFPEATFSAAAAITSNSTRVLVTDCPSGQMAHDIVEFGAYYYMQHMDDGTTVNQVTQAYATYEKAAVLDECPARYYLQWVDRNYGIQSQPFGNKTQFSEAFNTTEVKTPSVRQLANVTITSKWQLQSEWIPYENMYAYESIFSSPWCVLYDSELDKCYTVIPSDSSFTHKRYKNEKKLCSFTLNVEAAKEQSINR